MTSPLDLFFKFNIGDTVRPKVHQPGYLPNGTKFTPQMLVIVERALMECYGGVQAIYRCRAHTTQEGGILGPNYGGGYAFVSELIQLTEPELTAMPLPELSAEKPPRPARSTSPPNETEGG
jgi:hypothetical protein